MATKPLPTHLYHYTSIEALSQILATQQLRLSRLDKVDDLSEGETEDLGWYGHYIFVTCWTDLEEESLPFWSMYTTPRSAVRIKLPINMLVEQAIEYHDPATNGHISLPNSPLSKEQMFGSDYTVMPCKNNDWYKIKYTDDKKLLKPEVLSSGSRLEIQLGKIGLYKNLLWEFQSEYRFRVVAFPFSMNKMIRNISNLGPDIQELTNSMLTKKSLSIEHLNLDLDKSALAAIEITLGPGCDDGTEIIVRALLEKYASKSLLKRSVLTGKVALRTH